MAASAPGRTGKRRFYVQALSEAERSELAAAMEVDGIDIEIGVLRLRLQTWLKEHPDDLPLLLRGMDVLRRLVATKYGLAKGDSEALTEALADAAQRLMAVRGGEGSEEGGYDDA